METEAVFAGGITVRMPPPSLLNLSHQPLPADSKKDLSQSQLLFGSGFLATVQLRGQTGYWGEFTDKTSALL